MPSRKGMEQCLTWLRSKMAEKDTLDAINAEVCLNVIMDLERRRKAIGAMYHETKRTNQDLRNRIEEQIYKQYEEQMKIQHSSQALYEAALRAMTDYSQNEEQNAQQKHGS